MFGVNLGSWLVPCCIRAFPCVLLSSYGRSLPCTPRMHASVMNGKGRIIQVGKQCRCPLVALRQVLEQYMAPSVYAVVTGSAYGERQLMQVRARSVHPSRCKCLLVGQCSVCIRSAGSGCKSDAAHGCSPWPAMHRRSSRPSRS